MMNLVLWICVTFIRFFVLICCIVHLNTKEQSLLFPKFSAEFDEISPSFLEQIKRFKNYVTEARSQGRGIRRIYPLSDLKKI